MIEVTAEMVREFRHVALADEHGIEAGLRAVFAIVERDHEVRRLTPVVGREHASADEFGIVRCHTPGPDGARCERTPEHRGLHAFYGDDGRPDGPGELVRW